MNLLRRYRAWLMCIAALGVILGAASCCTIVPPNREVEAQWQAKVDAGESITLLGEQGLRGWRVSGLGVWQNRGGVLSVERGIGYLYTPIVLRDFVLTLDARLSPGANSGIFFRAQHPGFGLRPWPIGYEVQLDNRDAINFTGALYDQASASELHVGEDEWFRVRVHAEGERIEVFINNEKVVSTRDDEYASGFLALQAHHPTCRVEFRNIHLTPIQHRDF